MILSPVKEKTAVYLLLGLFLLLVLVFGSGSYTAALGSDPFGIVHFAQHLARGKFYSDFPVYDWAKPDWAPDESHFVLGGNYIKAGDRMYCKYTIGFPLLLALSIRILGDYSVYFLNLIVLLILLFALFRLALLFLRGRPGGRWLALAAPLILLVMVDPAWRLALRPSHDLAGIMFIVVGAALAVRALGDSPRIRIPALLAGAFAFGCAGTLRLPNVLAAVPAGMYFLVRVIGRTRWWKIILFSLLGLFLFFLALSPALIQNQLTGGHPLRPPRPEIVGGERTVLGRLDDQPDGSPPPLWIGFFPTTFPDVAGYFWRLWGPLFTFLALLGIISLRRRPETKWLLLGIPLILILLYSMWVHLMTRYMLAAHPFFIVLMVAGAGRLLRSRPRWWSAGGVALVVFLDYLFRNQFRYQHRMTHLNLAVLVVGILLWLLFVGGWRLKPAGRAPAILAAAFFGIFLVRYGVPWLRRPPLFQLAEAKRFGGDIDSLVPPESVIFSTKPIFQYINLFSSSYSLRPFEMTRIRLDSRKGFDRLLARGTGLYLLDNSSYKRDSGKAVPLFRDYYDLTPVGELPADRYHLSFQFGKPVCTVYRIEPWRVKEVDLEFDPPGEGSDFLLAFNLRKIHDPDDPRGLLEVELDGVEVPGPFVNGVNFLPVSRDDLSSGPVRFSVRSDRPLPRDLDLRVESLKSPYPVDLTGETGFPDRAAEDIFTEDRLRDGDLVRMGWERTGLVAIPVISLPGSALVGEVKVRRAQKLQEPFCLRVDLNGEKVGRFPTALGIGSEVFRFSLPGRLISSPRGDLEFTVSPPPTRPLSPSEEYWGSLFFESISVQRWFEEFSISPPPGQGAFIAFSLSPPPGETCPGPYRVLVNGEEKATAPGPGVQRLILGPGDGDRPALLLEARSPDDACRPLIVRPPLIREASERFRIEVGGEEDWAFLERGFYPPELHLGRTPVRWTKGESRIALPLIPREGKELKLTLKAIRIRPPAAFRTGPRVSARLDGRDLGEHFLREEDALYSWTLPAESGEPRVALLELRVDPWRPSSYFPTADRRRLGLMLEWMELAYRPAGE